MGEYTINHYNMAYEIETPNEALEFILNSDKSYFLKFSEEFENEVKNVLEDNWKAVALKKLYDTAGIDISEATIGNWRNNKNVPSREKAIQLCFVLNLDLEKSTLFLCKACNQESLNVKDPYELIYIYCLKYNKSYKVVEELKKEYEKAAIKTGDSTDDTTAVINWITNAEDNDKEFLSNLAVYSPILNKESNTVRNLFISYLNNLKNKVLIYNECYSNSNKTKKTKDIKKLNNEQLVNLLYLGIHPKEVGGRVDLSFSESSLKEYSPITENFPFRKRLDDIENGIIGPRRKDIILIFFFYFYFNCNCNTKEHFEDFHAELNDLLDEYRMSSLYSRSRFDWIILNAVNDDDPVVYWNDIIELSFPDNV